eukprot:gene3874-13938_t
MGKREIALLALLACCALISATARELRMTLLQAGTCRNTVQGMHFIADSNGLMCPRDDLDANSGCCSKGEKFACARCELSDRCCSQFEDCVSCCLDPKHGAEEQARITKRGPLHEPLLWADAFDYCRGTCRSHSRSTMHENAYIDSRHHCFSRLGKPMLSEALAPGALANVHVVMSAPRMSCVQACNSVQKSCSAPHLHILNSCDRLREHVNCEAGCDAYRVGSGAPGYIENGAPKNMRPAMCFVMPPPSVANITCEATETNMKRLCPCV